MKKTTTKSLEDSIREEALLLRQMVHKARRRERVLRSYRKNPSSRMRIRFKPADKRNATSVEFVGA